MPNSINKLFVPILRILNDGDCHSLLSLVDKLQSTPATISNALDVIVNNGFADITRVGNLGYKCDNPIVWLDICKIYQFCGSTPVVVHIIDTVESTNAFLLNTADDCKNSHDIVTVVVAEFQSGGRGRLGRKWRTGVGDSLTFSMRWYFECEASRLAGLSLVIGIAIIRVLKLFSIEYANLKWPNDVLFDFKKLAGVLVEIRSTVENSCLAIIGIGINFDLSDKITAAINQDQSITDLFAITGRKIDRNIFLGFLLMELYVVLNDFGQNGFTAFKQEWSDCQCYDGKLVELTLPDSTVTQGIAAGINDDGSFNLITPSGKKSFNVGDVSISLK